jgi:hypothetical protein
MQIKGLCLVVDRFSATSVGPCASTQPALSARDPTLDRLGGKIVPQGRNESSPALQCWVSVEKMCPSR